MYCHCSGYRFVPKTGYSNKNGGTEVLKYVFKNIQSPVFSFFDTNLEILTYSEGVIPTCDLKRLMKLLLLLNPSCSLMAWMV